MAERANEPRVLEPAARFIFQGDSAARKIAGDAFGVSLPETACRANRVMAGPRCGWVQTSICSSVRQLTRKASSLSWKRRFRASHIRWWRSANVRLQCK